MAQSQQETRITGDAAQFVQEVGKVIAKSKEHEAALKKLTGETKKLTTEEKKLAREAKRVYDDTRTPQERHTRKMEELNRLVRKGAIDQQTYRRAVRQSQGQLEQAGKAGRGAFGAGPLADLKSYAMGFVGVSAGIGLVTSALREQAQVRDEIAQKQRAAQFNIGALAQLAGGDPKRMAELEAGVLETRRTGGARSLQEAGRISFQLGSAGALGELGFVNRLATVAGEEGVAGMIGKAGKLRAALGEQETGTFKQIFSKAAAAAAPVTDVGIAEILQATAKAGGPAKAMGISDEELFAMVSLVSEVYSPDEASTAVSRMLDKLAVKGYGEKFKGRPAAEMMEDIRGQKLDPAGLQKLLDVRGLRAYRLLEPERLRKRLGKIREGQRTEAIEDVIAIGEGSDLVRAARDRERAEGAKEVAGLPLGIATNRFRSLVSRVQEDRMAAGDEWGAWGAGKVGTVAEMTYGPEALTSLSGAAEFATEAAVGVANRVGGGPLSFLMTTAGRLQAAAESLERMARQRPVQQNN